MAALHSRPLLCRCVAASSINAAIARTIAITATSQHLIEGVSGLTLPSESWDITWIPTSPDGVVKSFPIKDAAELRVRVLPVPVASFNDHPLAGTSAPHVCDLRTGALERSVIFLRLGRLHRVSTW